MTSPEEFTLEEAVESCSKIIGAALIEHFKTERFRASL